MPLPDYYGFEIVCIKCKHRKYNFIWEKCRVGVLFFSLGNLPCDPCDLLYVKSIQVRHGPGFYNCSLQWEGDEDGEKDTLVVQLSEDDQGLAAGQFVAFYQGSTCIGSGVILESWDDHAFPVCTKALEIARMEDKSSLGNPVKIKNKSDSPQEVQDNSTSGTQIHETGGHPEVTSTKKTILNWKGQPP